MRTVTVTAVLNGWMVKVGCQTLVYSDQKSLLKDLGEYMANPQAKEKKFISSAVNKRLMECPAIPEQACRPPDCPPQVQTANVGARIEPVGR